MILAAAADVIYTALKLDAQIKSKYALLSTTHSLGHHNKAQLHAGRWAVRRDSKAPVTSSKSYM